MVTKGSLGSAPRPARAMTAALGRIQLVFWSVTTLICAGFSLLLWTQLSQDVSQFSGEIMKVERAITCGFVRYHVSRYLEANHYEELLPGKTDTGLNDLLEDLVAQNRFIVNIRVVTTNRFHVAVAGELPPNVLTDDLRDRCCEHVPPGATSHSHSHSHSHAHADPDWPELTRQLYNTPTPPGMFHDPKKLDVFCVTDELYVGGKHVGGIAIHARNPMSRSLYEQTMRSMRTFILIAGLLLLLALALTIGFTGRETARIEERIAQSEREASLANLAAGVAHEVRNPLNTIALTCQYLLRKLETSSEPPTPGEDRAEARESLSLIVQEVDRLKGTIEGFLSVARAPHPQLQPEVDLNQLVMATLELLSPEIQEAGVTVAPQLGEVATLRADPQQLKEVIVNLVRNAVQAMGASAGSSMRQLRVSTRNSRRQVVLEVMDSGPGIASELHKHVFDPYFTTKPNGGGLGLAQVKQAVQAHDGTIEIGAASWTLPRSQPNQGAKVTVRLPSCGPATSSDSPQGAS